MLLRLVLVREFESRCGENVIFFYKNKKGSPELLRVPSVGKHSWTKVDKGWNFLAIKMPCKARTGVGMGEKSLRCDPGSELRLLIRGREKEGRR